MARFRIISGLLCALLFLTLLSGSAGAQSWFERLVMPGDLIEGHAKLEAECDNCHESFSKGAQAPLCVACHKEVGTDVTNKTGFHGRAPEVAQQECRFCHTDHIGRGADIVQLDTEIFDHSVTDFTLKGNHKAVACDGCHMPDKKFRDAPGSCVDCHLKDEPHQTRLGRDCENCHSETGWTDVAAFDHSKTKFALHGAHKTAQCSTCHIGEVYTGLPTECVGCHRSQDVHNGTFSQKCETCHSPAKWTEVRFDHDKDTDFALTGKHAKTACYDCHSGTTPAADAPTTCIGCHEKDDPHKGELGRECDSCHKTTGWREQVAFDHDITRFPLIGLHVLVPCEECHLDPTFHTAEPDCESCHAGDDSHEGRLGKACATCHNPNGWDYWAFNHTTQTNYPLTGAHDGLVCNACHTNERKARLKISTACVACHAKNDVHRGMFGQRCSQCHSTTKFTGARLRK